MTWLCAGCHGENPDGTRFCGLCGSPKDAAPAGEAAPEQVQADAVIDVLRSFVSTSVADRLVASGGRFTEERRLVTALFADLSGFTRLASSMDPEQLLEIIDPVIRGLTDVVSEFGGTVEKFAGDALLALFGAPVAHDDDADRALRTALEMHQRLAVISPLPPGELTLHIGINSGHVVARVIGGDVRLDYAVLGDTVVLAQRLESQTPTGQTYVGETTHRLAGARFAFEEVPPLVLKGREHPEPAWRLLGEHDVVAAGAPLHGRVEEAAAVRALVEQARTGTGGTVLVTGEPGAGKSHLVADAREQAPAGTTWVSGQCLSYGAAVPYRPWVEVVRALAEGRELDPYLQYLVGDPGVSLPEQGPEALRRGLHGAVLTLLTDAAREQPLVCVLEDLHWADASSLDLIKELLPLLAEVPIALVMTARSGQVPLVVETVPLVSLQRMDEAALAELAEEVLGGPPPERLVTLLADRCAGNPLFTRELTRALRDEGVLRRDDGRWRLPPGWHPDRVPETVEGVLAARIDQLPPQAAEVLQAAAVIGRRVRLPLLAALVPDGALQSALPVLVGAGLLVDDGTDYLFHHALLQEAAYNRLLRKRRRELHLTAAEAARELYGDGDESVEFLARHLYLGEAGASALGALRRAGNRARTIYANDEAVLHLSRAAEVCRAHPETAGELTEILLALGELQELQGSYEAAQASYDELIERTDDARAWAGRASSLRRRGDLEEAEQTLDRALASPRAGDVRVLWFELSWVRSTHSRWRQAEEAARAGLALSPPEPDRLTGQLLLRLALLQTEDGRAEEALGHAQTALDAFVAAQDLSGEAQALRLLGGALEACSRYDEAAVVLRRGLAAAERVGSVEEICGCLVNLGALALRTGDYASGLADTVRAVEELRRVDHKVGVAIATSNLGELLLVSGSVDEASRQLEEARQLSEDLGYTSLLADVHHNLARVRAARGEHGAAAEEAGLAADLFAKADVDARVEESLRLAQQSWLLAGDPHRAADCARRLEGLARPPGP